MTLYSLEETSIFNNKPPFPNQMRMVIIGSSGTGKTKLLFRFLLENYFSFEKIVFCSPSLAQLEYQVIIKSLEHGLSIDQIKNIFENQNGINLKI